MTPAILLSTLGIEQAVAAPLPGEARIVLALPAGNAPEGITIDDDGTIYLSNRYPTEAGQASEIVRLGDDGRLSVLASFAATDQPGAGLRNVVATSSQETAGMDETGRVRICAKMTEFHPLYSMDSRRTRKVGTSIDTMSG
jgi:hypothetical protein